MVEAEAILLEVESEKLAVEIAGDVDAAAIELNDEGVL